MGLIRFKTQDDEIFAVEENIVRTWVTMKKMLEALTEVDDNEIVKIEKVSSHIMRLVIEWSTHHVSDLEICEMEVVDCEDKEILRSDNIDPWDEELLKPLSTVALCELMNACNFLEIKGLLATASKTLANLIKGKSLEQVREVFQLPDPPQKSSSDNEEL